MPTTSVLRLILPLIFSSGRSLPEASASAACWRSWRRVVLCSLALCYGGKVMVASMPASLSSTRTASFGTFGRSWSATRRYCWCAASTSPWANAVTIKADGTVDDHLRRPPATAGLMLISR